MLMLDLNETLDRLAMACSVCWYSHVLWREDGHFLRKVLGLDVDGQIKSQRLKNTLVKQVEEESITVGMIRGSVLC